MKSTVVEVMRKWRLGVIAAAVVATILAMATITYFALDPWECGSKFSTDPIGILGLLFWIFVPPFWFFIERYVLFEGKLVALGNRGWESASQRQAREKRALAKLQEAQGMAKPIWAAVVVILLFFVDLHGT